MTKSERATLWFQNGVKRKRDKEIEAHVGYISRQVIIIGTIFILIVVLIKNMV